MRSESTLDSRTQLSLRDLLSEEEIALLLAKDSGALDSRARALREVSDRIDQSSNGAMSEAEIESLIEELRRGPSE